MTDTFRHEKRKPLTPQQRARLFLEAGGRCSVCQLKVGQKEWHDDHVIALENGGTNEWHNRRVVCHACHKRKTVTDHGQAAKGRGQAVMMSVPTGQRSKRPMPGSRASGLKKRMDGTVVKR